MRIALIRGDIDYERFLITDREGNPVDVDFDEIYFTVKTSTKTPVVLFQKKLSDSQIEKLGDGDYQVKINSSDTDNLAYGNYVFDIQFVYQDIIKKTFVGVFAVLDEVTYLQNE